MLNPPRRSRALLLLVTAALACVVTACIYDPNDRCGPAMTYEFASASPATTSPSYAQIMNLADADGHNWSYLAAEDTFQYVHEMQRKNLIVPLVGDFSASVPGAFEDLPM